ncbi:MAG: hypothetical protein BGO86_01750 [Chryseobacterium sp. 36-9]|nr:MAG: hypothetical protein BGO86_01750 [Chryseobacterium sp. 36-9]
MKKLNFIFINLFALFLISCGTSSNFSQNTLNKNFYNSKTIYFKLNSDSQRIINYKGIYTNILGPSEAPDVNMVFKESIEELAAETKFNLKYVENWNGLTSNESNILVETKITDILWSFGFSVATLKSNVVYTIPINNQIYNTEGIRKSGGGDPSNNLRKSLKVATYNFLKELEK